MHKLLPTTLVGSYPQPEWLIDRRKLAGRFPPRVRARELWRIAPEWLDQAQNDATLLAIRDQELAGLDVITDGEMRRESYSNRFATALDGVDIDNPGTALDRSGHPNPVPRVVGPVRRRGPVETEDVRFLRTNTDRTIKITVPGAFTMAQQAQDDYDRDEVALAMDYAAAVNAEIKDLFAPEGVPIVPFAEGITTTARNPNAARLFLNWRLSKEGQTFLIKELGHVSSMKEPPLYPKGWDPKTVKAWLPDFDQFEKLREGWLAEWNKTYNYRQ